MVDTIASADVLYPYGGTQANNLIHILRSNDDNDISTLKFSPYMDLNTVNHIYKTIETTLQSLR